MNSSAETMGRMEEEVMSFLDDQDQHRSSSGCYKPVPWLTWDEWDDVRESLFSSSADKVASALKRISTWRTRGSLPAPVDVTASIIEIQQKDGFVAREKQPVDALYSEHLLQLLYCMAILRLVNCVIEKTRRRSEVSIGEAAEAIGIPRKLIDLRHEGSHRELPALSVLRDASDEALDWLKSYYWEPQRYLIPFKKDASADIRREIKSKLRKLAFCLKFRQNPQLGSAVIKAKCSKKRIRRILNTLLELYSSYTSEVVSVLLELLWKALDSTNQADIAKDPEPAHECGGLLHEWKLVILELSNKEPELLLSLLQAFIGWTESKEQRRYDIEDLVSEFKEYSQTDHFPLLFSWLVGRLKGLEHFQTNSSSEVKPSTAILMELLRKCLLLSASTNVRFMDSALELAEIMGGRVWREKIKKLPLMLTQDVMKDSPQINMDQEKSIQDAAKKLEFIKLELSKRKPKATKETDFGTTKRWVKAKSWNPCPIGTLPRILGFSGRSPLLDCTETQETAQAISNSKEHCSGKREAELSIQQLDDSSLKRARETVNPDPQKDGARDLNESSFKASELVTSLGLGEARGCLMIGGTWKRVGEEELLGIASAVRILV